MRERACVRNYEPVSKGVPQVNEAQTLVRTAMPAVGVEAGGTETTVPRTGATEQSAVRLVALRQAGFAVVAVALAVLVTLTRPCGAQELDVFNGFESGGVGDYTVGAGTPSGSLFHRLDASGQFGPETAAVGGANEYVQVALSAASTSVTDGIWMCVETAPLTTARRVRSWMSGATVVVELRLLPSQQLQISV